MLGKCTAYLGVWLVAMLGLGHSASCQQLAWLRDFYDFKKTSLKTECQVLAQNSNVRSGLYISYYANTAIQCKGRYVNNLQNGRWTYFYENANKKSEGEYLLSEKTGVWEYYFENGNPMQTGRLSANKKQGYWKYFYESGATKVEGDYLEDKCNGLWNYYNEDGTLKATCKFLKGRGFYTENFANGGPKMQGMLNDGGSDSSWVYYYENGAKKAEGLEKNSIKLGNWRFYTMDGALASQGAFEANQETGPWVYYHTNGQISSKGLMLSGKKEGVWQLFYDTGKFMGEAKFENGIGKYVEYYPTGKVKLTGFIEGTRYTGSWTYYHPDATIDGECYYVNGEGDYIGYYTDGSKRMSGRLKNGKKIGIWKLYDNEGNLSGLYRTYFEGEDSQLFADSSSITEAPTLAANSPKTPAKMKMLRPIRFSQFFKPRVNEKQAFILAINPLGPLFFQIPLSIEYYFDKRAGYEAGLIVTRKPFLGNHAQYLGQFYGSSVSSGISLYVRQKLYFGRKKPDSFYFAQELRYGQISHREANKQGSGDSTIISREISTANETRYEISLLLGKRFFANMGSSTFTLDVFAGLGTGYRSVLYTKNSVKISELPNNKVTLPVRLGITTGFVF